jgi:type IV pilus assembly protein PilB
MTREPAHTTYHDATLARFGELLLSQSLVNRHNLDIAIDHSDRRHVPLADSVVALGFVTEHDSYAALAEFSGLRLVDLSELTPSKLALRLVPERVARRHILLPLTEDNRLLTYAISQPFDDEAQRDVAFASGRNPKAVVARRSDLVAALDKYYQQLSDLDLLLARVRSEASIEMVDCGDASARTSSPIIDLCNHIIARAVEAKASDVHIEPTREGLIVRYRLGGILEPELTLPVEAAMTIRNRYKVMARVDISVQHRPQDGAFRLMVNGRAVDVRLSTLPTINGEKLVMRVIDSRDEPKGLESLGYDADNLGRLKKALDRPDGLVLVTGPTGSGKTTVLYSSLHHLRSGSTNIVTVEDPVERQIDGVNQIAVNSKAGNSFAAVLRSVLRQDPNVIMVGEIRDNEVAQIVGQAAYTLPMRLRPSRACSTSAWNRSRSPRASRRSWRSGSCANSAPLAEKYTTRLKPRGLGASTGSRWSGRRPATAAINAGTLVTSTGSPLRKFSRPTIRCARRSAAAQPRSSFAPRCTPRAADRCASRGWRWSWRASPRSRRSIASWRPSRFAARGTLTAAGF